jgi:lysyl-tRNA synthetase class II
MKMATQKQVVKPIEEIPSAGVVSSTGNNVASNGALAQERAEKLVKEKKTKAKPKQKKVKKDNAAVAKAEKEAAQHTVARLEARAGRLVDMIASRKKTVAKLQDTIGKLSKLLEETQADLKKAKEAV